MVPLAGSGNGQVVRFRITITGIVQGVGFRPFVYRLATELGLTGWVNNDGSGVTVEAQSTQERLSHFRRRIQAEAPPLARIGSLSCRAVPEVGGETGFLILVSSSAGEASAQLPPDSAVCPGCLRELFDPADRRFLHPFISCTDCGPRYSIITAIPYDRPATTMAAFPLCDDCRREYHDPADRRFHAQPVCCPACGPRLMLRAGKGGDPRADGAALDGARRMLAEGRILAVKGIGGYHLAVDAFNHEAVARLRRRKKRDEKPFAVMAPDLETVGGLAVLNDMEARLLASPEAPIVIVRRRPGSGLAPLIAPNNGWLGVMLPYTPLHHLLLAPPPARSLSGDQEEEPSRVLVMTSGNVSDEPIACLDDDAFERLDGIADAFLTHDRPIHIRQDDSVIRVFQGEALFYRRARGYTPRACPLPFEVPPLLAVGAELKSAICLASGDRALVSQHLGDLQNEATAGAFRQAVGHLSRLFRITPESVACDLHPDYLSSLFAEETGLPLVRVQHHHAHLAACMADNGLTGEVVGLIFDGTGYGEDGTIWGGEVLAGGYDGVRRAAHFQPVRLPGGDAAVRQPWRMALSCLHRTLGDAALEIDHPVARCLGDAERPLFAAMLARGINSPLTSSCGRLFDAAAAITGLRCAVSYDGQAPIELEALAETSGDSGCYPFELNENIDLMPAFPAMLDDLRRGVAPAVMARRFHATVAAAAVESCCRAASEAGLMRAVLSGGVFQNRLLAEMVYSGLSSRGLQVFSHRLTPPNDGCIALGQAAVAGWKARR